MPIREVCSPVNSLKRPAPMPHSADRSIKHAGVYGTRSDQKLPRRADRDPSNPDPFPGGAVSGQIDLRKG
jgi:hypothetical protein